MIKIYGESERNGQVFLSSLFGIISAVWSKNDLYLKTLRETFRLNLISWQLTLVSVSACLFVLSQSDEILLFNCSENVIFGTSEDILYIESTRISVKNPNTVIYLDCDCIFWWDDCKFFLNGISEDSILVRQVPQYDACYGNEFGDCAILKCSNNNVVFVSVSSNFLSNNDDTLWTNFEFSRNTSMCWCIDRSNQYRFIAVLENLSFSFIFPVLSEKRFEEWKILRNVEFLPSSISKILQEDVQMCAYTSKFQQIEFWISSKSLLLSYQPSIDLQKFICKHNCFASTNYALAIMKVRFINAVIFSKDDTNLRKIFRQNFETDVYDSFYNERSSFGVM